MNKMFPHRVWWICGAALLLQWSVDALQWAWLEPLSLLVVLLPWLTRDVRAIIGAAIGAGLLRETLQWTPFGFYAGPYLLVALALWRVARAIPQQHRLLQWGSSFAGFFVIRLLQHFLRAV